MVREGYSNSTLFAVVAAALAVQAWRHRKLTRKLVNVADHAIKLAEHERELREAFESPMIHVLVDKMFGDDVA